MIFAKSEHCDAQNHVFVLDLRNVPVLYKIRQAEGLPEASYTSTYLRQPQIHISAFFF